MVIRSHPRFEIEIEAEKAKAVVRAAKGITGDETGVRIEGTNYYHWVFHCEGAVVHQPDYSRAARVVDEMMAGHKPVVWISDRYSAQQRYGDRHQTCLAHLARDTAFALERGSDDLPLRFKLWLEERSIWPKPSPIWPPRPWRGRSESWKNNSPRFCPR